MMGEEVRKRIIEARERGVTVGELSRGNGVSARSIFRLQARYRKTGSIAVQTHMRGRKSSVGEEELSKIDECLQKAPDITLKELREELQLPIQVSRLSQIIREKLGYTYKKRWFMPQNKTDLTYKSNENNGWKCSQE